MDRTTRDLILAGWMQWAGLFHHVRLILMAHGGHVIIHGLIAFRPGHGHARTVMTELCLWADCAAVTLQLTPYDRWGADIGRLTGFYRSLGFTHNTQPPQPFTLQGELIRHPRAGHGHPRPCGGGHGRRC